MKNNEEVVKMLEHVKRFMTDQEGQGMAEYGLILALIAVVVIGALTTLGGQIEKIFDKTGEKMEIPPEAAGD